MKHLFTKKHYTAILFSLVLLCNPNFHTVDILPDFIGYFLMASAIGHAADIAPYFAEMKTWLNRLGIITLVKLPATLVMYGNMHAGRDIVPLFTLSFAILELISLLALISNAYKGLCYLGQRSDIKSLISPIKMFGMDITADGLRGLTTLFVVAKAVLNTLPTVCLLTYTDPNMARLAQSLYAPLELGSLGIVLLFGVAWCVICSAYVKGVAKEGGVGDGLMAMAGEMKLGEIDRKIKQRKLLGGVTLLFFSIFFTFDISFRQTNNVNILPHFIFAIIIFIAFCRLCTDKRLHRILTIAFSLSVLTNVIYQIVSAAFFDKYTYLDILELRPAKEMYMWVEISSVIETVAFLGLYVILVLSLASSIRENTGTSPREQGYSRASKDRHKSLINKGIGMFVILALVSISKCINVFLWGNPHSEFTEGADGVIDIMAEPTFSWFGTIIFALSVVCVIYAYMFTNELKDEIKIKYDINS